ncbi:MAG: thioredoxin-dependent thiol peroxidase [Alphaproteobacteria bacterium]|nr:thioredoxin-dependent thiol peroxidase [Alphaproteobacteria bacterium]OJV15707.1 MAG: peroxiredoxin [Alphaproteobacteria bacterium 33-17]
MNNNSFLQILLEDDSGNKRKLADLKGKRIVLYFYPKDDTPGCTVEAQNFRDLTPEFNEHNTIILGVSKDNVDSHSRFKSKYCLPFNLLSDINGELVEAFGVWVEKNMYGKKSMGIERSTFIINEAGEVIKSWKKVSVNDHAKEVLEYIKSL